MNRRDLLKYTGAAGAIGLLAGTRATKLFASPPRAQKPQRRLIMVMAQGGWDTTYAVDPKEPGPDVDIAPGGTITRFGSSLDVYTDPARPNVTSFFTKYAGASAIIRGISVGSVAHPECVKRMSTGTRNETNPDLSAIVAHDNGNDLPLPYLILGDTAFAGEYAVSAGRVGATNQILAVLDPAQAYQTNGRGPVATSAAEDAILARYATASANRMRATRGSQGYNRKRVDDFESSIDRGKKLVAARAGFGSRGRTLTLDSQVDLALDALEQDISQSVMLNTRLGWDTHDTNTDQAGFHETTFGGLTRLLDGLSARNGRQAGSKMIDDTTVVCFSEFSRTPKLNANQGKDHWPVACAVVMGAGVKGGASYGATNDGVETMAIDFATGLPSDSGRVLTYNQFTAGLLQLCGVDPTAHIGSVEVFDAFVA